MGYDLKNASARRESHIRRYRRDHCCLDRFRCNLRLGSGEPVKTAVSVAIAVSIGGGLWSGNLLGGIAIGLIAGALAYAIVQ